MTSATRAARAGCEAVGDVLRLGCAQPTGPLERLPLATIDEAPPRLLGPRLAVETVALLLAIFALECGDSFGQAARGNCRPVPARQHPVADRSAAQEREPHSFTASSLVQRPFRKRHRPAAWPGDGGQGTGLPCA